MLVQRFGKTAYLIICAGLALSSCVPLPVPSTLLSGERTIAANTTTLMEKWSYRIDEILNAPLVYQENMLYVPQGDTLNGLDVETGSRKWAFTNHRQISTIQPQITSSENLVVFETEESFGERQDINVLDAKTGELKWTQPLSTVYSFSIGNSQLYVGWLGHVSAYDLRDGALRWKTSEGLPGRSAINVYYQEGQLYATTYNRVHLLDSKDGHEQSSFEYPNAEFEVLSQGTLFSVVWPEILSTSAETGAVRWRKKLRPDATYVAPSLLANALYVRTASGTLVSLDAKTGEMNWESKELRNPFSNVVSFHDKGYIVSKDASLRVFDLGRGEEKGALVTTPKELASWWMGAPAIPSLAVAGDTLVVTFGDSYVYAFQERTP